MTGNQTASMLPNSLDRKFKLLVHQILNHSKAQNSFDFHSPKEEKAFARGLLITFTKSNHTLTRPPVAPRTAGSN